MPAEQTITRWECPSERCTTGGVLVNGPCNSRLRASGECIAVKRTYVAADTLGEWIDERRDEAKQWDTPAARSHCLVLDHLAALLDDLTTGGETDG